MLIHVPKKVVTKVEVSREQWQGQLWLYFSSEVYKLFQGYTCNNVFASTSQHDPLSPLAPWRDHKNVGNSTRQTELLKEIAHNTNFCSFDGKCTTHKNRLPRQCEEVANTTTLKVLKTQSNITLPLIFQLWSHITHTVSFSRSKKKIPRYNLWGFFNNHVFVNAKFGPSWHFRLILPSTHYLLWRQGIKKLHTIILW